MSDTSNDSIMGFIPKNKYVEYTYYLLLVGAAGGLLLSLLGIMGILIPLGGLFQLAGLIGLILALLGFFVFKKDFSSLDQSHLLYLAVVFGVFFVISIVIGVSLFMSLILLYAVTFLIGAIYLLILWTGFNSWKHGRTVTKDNIKSEIQLALKRS